MSYTQFDSEVDLNDLIVSAINSEDMEYVAQVAQTLAEVPGWEEEALYLRNRYRRDEAQAWAYDEDRDNNL